MEKYIGVRTADAERVELQYRAGCLRLVYVDWQEQQCEAVFKEVLAFRWQEQDEESLPRDDATTRRTRYWIPSGLPVIRPRKRKPSATPTTSCASTPAAHSMFFAKPLTRMSRPHQMAANPSIERTGSSRLRLLPTAAHVKR